MTNRCPICHRMLINNAKICEQCSRTTRERLAEIPPMWIEAGAYLIPGKGGFGSSGSERTIGVNLSALGFRAADEILPILEDWERTVRVKSLGQVELDGYERQGEVEMNKDGTVKVVVRPRSDRFERPTIRTGAIQERVEGACLFLLAHARWLTEYEVAPEWFEDIAKIHAQGSAATRKFAEKLTRIKCPTSLEVFTTEDEIGYEYCGAWLTLGGNPLDPVKCARCRAEWTTIRLVAVALSTPGNEIRLEPVAIAGWLEMDLTYVYKFAKRHGIEKVKGKYSLNAFMKARATLNQRDTPTG